MTREWADALRRGAFDALQRLLAEGADIDARDQHGQTALMCAARDGQQPVIAWLVEQGAALDRTAKYGLSALMLAVVNGHIEAVRTLTGAGANRDLRGTGVPGFAGKTALDLATARGDAEMVSVLRPDGTGGPANPHFETPLNRRAARDLVGFAPREPSDTAGWRLRTLRVHVRDHKQRRLPLAERTLEAHYEGFVVSQSRRSAGEARRLALVVSYGPSAREGSVAGHQARLYELGPVPPADDIDGRSPAVVTWCDGEMFFLVASGELPVDTLVRVANSLY